MDRERGKRKGLRVRKRRSGAGFPGGRRRKAPRAVRKSPARKRVAPVRPSPTGPEVLFTIGIGKRSLQMLLQLLVDNGIELVVDVRPYAAESGPGFTRARDLAFLLKELAGIEYRREEVLLPPREMLEQYHRDRNWKRFETSYLGMLETEKVEGKLNRELYAPVRACLLGNEESPDKDYRRLAAEYLKIRWGITQVLNL